MSERARSLIAIYLAFIACCLAVASMKEDDFKSAANRADLRVTVMEIKGQTNTITGMRSIRNEQRARGDRMEAAVLLLTIAFAVATPALIAGVYGGWMLILVSWVASGSAAYFAFLAAAG
jgi:hypothetical protein